MPVYGTSTECPEDTAILNRLINPFPPTLVFILTQSYFLCFIHDFLHFPVYCNYVSNSLNSNASRSSLLYQLASLSFHIYNNTFLSYILLSSGYHEDGASRLIWKAGNYKPICTVSYLRILQPSLALLYEPQVWQNIKKIYEETAYSGMWHHLVLQTVYWHFRRTCCHHQVDGIQFKQRYSGSQQTHCKRDRLRAGCSQMVFGTSKGGRTDWRYETTCAVSDTADVHSCKYHCLRSVIL
jgi:hypothetical protein